MFLEFDRYLEEKQKQEPIQAERVVPPQPAPRIQPKTEAEIAKKNIAEIIEKLRRDKTEHPDIFDKHEPRTNPKGP